MISPVKLLVADADAFKCVGVFVGCIRASYLDCDAGVAELVDALDLGSSGAIRGGSSPPFRMFCKKKNDVWLSGIDPLWWRERNERASKRKCLDLGGA